MIPDKGHEQPQNNFWDDAEVIYSYSREQAVEDGVLVDVTDLAQEAGIKFPTVITNSLQARLTPSEREEGYGQSFTGRLWDVLSLFTFHAKKARGDRMDYFIYVWRMLDDGPTQTELHMRAVIGPGDTPDPVITIGLPGDF